MKQSALSLHQLPVDTCDEEGGNMKHSNESYGTIALRTLYQTDLGQSVHTVQDLVRLASPKLDHIDESTLVNIIGSSDGLYGQGLVDCKRLEGDGAILEIRDIRLTEHGRAHVAKTMPRTWLVATLQWVTRNVIGACISAAAGAVVGWLLRGIIEPR